MITRISAAVLVLVGFSIAQIPAPMPVPAHPEGFHAFAGHRPPGPPAWWKNPDVAQSLGLSDAQVQQLDELSLNHRMKMIDLRAGLEREELRLESLMQAPNPDENQILSQVEKVSAQRTQVEKANVQFGLASRRVLTPDQRKKLPTSMPFGRAMHYRPEPMHDPFGRERRPGGEPRGENLPPTDPNSHPDADPFSGR